MKKIFSYQIKWKDYELFFVLFFTWTYIVSSILGLTRRFINVGILDIVTLDLFLLLLFINVFRTFQQRLKLWPIIGSICLLFVLFFASLLSTQRETNFAVIGDVLKNCLPLLIFGSCVRDYGKVFYYLGLVLSIFVIYSFITYFIFGVSLEDGQKYSQQQSYRMLLPAVFFLFETLEHFSIKSLFFFTFSLFLVFAYGARGPFVAISVFFVLYVLLFFLKKQKNKRSKFSLVLFSVMLLFAIIRYGDSFLMYGDVLSNMGMSTRTVTMLSDGSILEDESRNQLSKICIQGIREYPLLGVGPVNDRNYIGQYFFSDEENTGKYPHNVFLEVFFQFGLLIGLILLVQFFRLVYYTYKRTKDEHLPKLMIILFSVYFIPLMYSGSYLTQEGLYVLLAFCITNTKLEKLTS